MLKTDKAIEFLEKLCSGNEEIPPEEVITTLRNIIELLKSVKQSSNKELIEEAVRAGIRAALVERTNSPDDPYKQTQRRLEAIIILQDRIADNKARLEGLKEIGVQEKSKSIVRFSASGVRADPMEMYDAVLADLEAHIAIDEEEVEAVMRAMMYYQNDRYFNVVYDKYIEGKTDVEIAEESFCDESTVRRNRGRLVHMIAVRLYGAVAL